MDREVTRALRQHGPAPVASWRVVNGLADARDPDSRAQRRCLRLRYLGALRDLVRAKIVYRHVGLIALQDFALRPKRRLSQPLSPFVVNSN